MRRRAKLVEYDLALRYSSTGRLRDLLLGTDHFPLLTLGPWILADGGSRSLDRLGAPVLVGSFLLLASEHVMEQLDDEATYYGPSDAELAQELARLADEELGPRSCAPGQVASPREGDGPRTVPSDPADLLGAPRWGMSARRVAVAAMSARGGTASTSLLSLVDDLAAAYTIRADLMTVHRDLERGRLTYATATAARAAGTDALDPSEAAQLMGTIVLARAHDAMLEEAVRRIGRALTAAGPLALPTLSGYLRDASDAFSSLGRPGAGARAVFRLADRPAKEAIAMAAGYLTADRELRESWEVHREGMFGAPLVVSRFPEALILEVLRDLGHDVADPTRDLVRFMTDRGFRYYDHPASYADTDTVGAVLRLAGAAAYDCDGMHDVLERIDARTAELGAIPVWVEPCQGPVVPQLLLGEHCATVQAHFLLGLAQAGARGREHLFRAGVSALLRRVASIGLEANVNYPPAFAAGALARLASVLGPGGAALREVLAREVAEMARGRDPTPQDAALLITASLRLGRRDLLRREWTATVVKGQRNDGAWLAEPFAATPSRGNAVV